MSAMQNLGQQLEFNKQGHLARFDDWNPSVAQALAEEEGLALTECHWAVIDFLREYYGTHEIPPSPRVVIKTVGARVSPHVSCSRKHLEALFPNGGCKQACRLAGLPRYYCHSC
ncbi:TusE/DsrC/DsvC family sulfurtransferase [Thiocapsa imhoffii]|uniref:Sulfurtransferase n=1 Tax=Thiocapsa imhoffii TaxID=382777 RepID=A0A9X0WLC5_9GAMM|nr:TusE/DsrC/DsvC family sulfur relay protein [Thiocapsa imhoffii]MBK1646646.1 TusE/DsrC/DsvC family sulfurtransferase [Thiocapsa imhoffii]